MRGGRDESGRKERLLVQSSARVALPDLVALRPCSFLQVTVKVLDQPTAHLDLRHLFLCSSRGPQRERRGLRFAGRPSSLPSSGGLQRARGAHRCKLSATRRYLGCRALLQEQGGLLCRTPSFLGAEASPVVCSRHHRASCLGQDICSQLRLIMLLGVLGSPRLSQGSWGEAANRSAK